MSVDKSGRSVARVKSRWQLDFSSRPGHGADLLSPPGYSASTSNLSREEISREADPNLRIKRSWDLALGPFKQVPMNLFIMWMSGNTISIFPIMMVFMMMFRPFKTLFSVSQTFKGFETSGGGVTFLGQKIVFVLGNLANVALAMYKCHSMGLLPTHVSGQLRGFEIFSLIFLIFRLVGLR